MMGSFFSPPTVSTPYTIYTVGLLSATLVRLTLPLCVAMETLLRHSSALCNTHHSERESESKLQNFAYDA